jgi:methionyl-tRNA formyltransferase
MRLVFLGTPAFAVPALNALVEAGHEVLTVLTQPDRPRGRGRETSAPPVKQAAMQQGLTVYQPERVRRPEAVEYLRGVAPDAMVVVGYGQIIPQSVIDIAPLGILNVHASLLPRYRGAAPVQWAIAQGEAATGVTIMRIDAGLDTGDILRTCETAIGREENAIELGERLALLGARLLVETLDDYAAGAIQPQKQDSAQATYAPILKKEDGLIDWSQPAAVLHNRVRGFQPWPGAYTGFRGQTLNIWRARVATLPDKPAVPPGGFLRLKPPTVAAGEGALELVEVQLEGRKRMAAADFANGQRLQENEILGEPHR